MKHLFSLLINYILRSSEMQYGDRCRVTSCLKDWYQTQNQPPLLKPEALVKRELGHKAKMISGPEISTPTASSRKKLITELLQIIRDISDVNWEDRDDLDLSLKSLDSSFSSTSSSSDGEWEITPPQSPPLGGVMPRSAKMPKLKYVNFGKYDSA
nr:ORF3 [Torque teno felis virus]